MASVKRMVRAYSLQFRFGILLVLAFPALADLASARRAYERGDYSAAFREFLRLAEADDARAESAVAYMYYAGKGVARNGGEAARHGEIAAMAGVVAPQWLETDGSGRGIIPSKTSAALARLEDGQGTDDDYAQLAEWYKSAPSGSTDPRQIFGAIARIEIGQATAADYQQVAQMYRPSADQGDPEAQYRLGLLCMAEKGDEDCSKWYRLAAAQGNVAAQVNAAMHASPSEAAKWYEAAANQGDALAEYSIGEFYLDGDGVPRDYTRGLKWLRASAEQRYSEAMHELPELLDKWCGERTPTTGDQPKPIDSKGQQLACDPAEAARWYRRGADRGDPECQDHLGQMYLKGRGVPQSDSAALKWFRLASAQGYAFAQLDLARVYKDGRGVPQDYVLACMWANLAASRVADLPNWDNLAPNSQTYLRRSFAQARDEFAALMTPNQIADAQALARDWKPSKRGESPGGQDGDSAPQADEPEIFAGTGFVVNGRGNAVTNHHVVDGCAQIMVLSPVAQQKVEVVADDAQNDLAVVGPIKQLADSLPLSGDPPKLGQSVIVVGYPLQGILASSLNVTTGTVSALAGLEDDTRMIQITAPVQPGNSGGPLLDQHGAVVGVVSSKLNALKAAELTGDLPQNVNFAIRGATVRAFLDANGIEYAPQTTGANLDTVSIADQARKAVIRIECHK